MDASPNAPNPKRKTSRRPRRSASLPAGSRNPVTESTYPSDTHWVMVNAASNSRASAGSATLTTPLSRVTMKMPLPETNSTFHLK